tara:strand:+ start:6393 stop:7595 length:1203 start_codon:yes stop_codon:yes gene_type:complete
MFYFNFFGSRIILFQLITLLYFPFLISQKKGKIFSIINGIKFEYIILIFTGILFGFLFPWEYESYSRNWNQLASGRSIVALINILAEILLIYFTYFLFVSKKVLMKDFINALSILVIIVSLTSLIDIFFNYPIYSSLFGREAVTISNAGRLLGFSHEPRSLGRLITLGWLFLLIFKINGYRFSYDKISLSLGLVVILLIFSFSTYFIFILGLLIVLRKKLLRINLKYIFGIVFLGFIFFQVISNNKFSGAMLYKFATVTEGRIDLYNTYQDEPLFFSTLEVFDRAASNFFNKNPNYLFFGTGPNLISLASQAINSAGPINGIPGNGILALVSRSGLVGLFLYFMVCRKIYKLLKIENNKLLMDLFLVTVFTYIFVRSPWLYFIIGLVIAHIQLKLFKNND